MKKIAMFVTLLAVMIAVGGCVEYTATREATVPSTTPETQATEATSATSAGTGETASTAETKDYNGDELQRLRDAAFDPDAKSFISAQINFMYPSQEDGSRKMGDVFAYYGLMDVDANTPKSYAKMFIKKYMVGLTDYLVDAEDIEEDGSYALGLTLENESFVFWPDEDLNGITVIYSANAGESAADIASEAE